MGAMKNLQIDIMNEGVYECPNTGMFIPTGQDPLTDEDIAEMEKVFQMTEEEYEMYWNS